jgi:protein subunit release factor B
MRSLSFGVRKEKEELLEMNMKRLGVREEHLQEKFLFSGKKGGQNANRTATKVQLKHLPTGIIVTCAKERYQRLNRFLARRILLEKLELFYNQKKIGTIAALNDIQKHEPHLPTKIEKKQKQKARRTRRSQKKYHEE